LLLPLLEGGVIDEIPMLVLVLTVEEALVDEASVLLLLRTELREPPELDSWFVRDKEDPGIPLLLLKDGLPVLEDGIAVDVKYGVLWGWEKDGTFEDTGLSVLWAMFPVLIRDLELGGITLDELNPKP
jgi:hypothetical protein